MKDLIVVGAGPAGIAAALWARSLALDVALFEQDAHAGGQLWRVHFEPPQLALAVAGTGETLAEHASRRLAERGIELESTTRITALLDSPRGVALAGGTHREARAVIVATGLRARKLEAPGAERLTGRGVSDSATRDRERFAGRRMVVVGAGDAAYENALILRGAGCEVSIVQRGASHARESFVSRVASDPRIQVIEGVTVAEVVGESQVSAVMLERANGETTRLECEGVVVKIGQVPNSEWCAAAVERDRDGFVSVTEGGRTSRPGVWAAGDVTRPRLLAIPVAEAAGALAVRAVADWLTSGASLAGWR